jgi:large subunit ribosomal protein L17
MHERINTTLQKAKEIRRIVDKMVTLGKRGDLHARRQAAEYLFDDAATAKVFSDLATRFKNRNGGYTRILKRGPKRVGDSADQAIIEFVDFNFGETEKTEKKPKEDAKKA